MRISKQTSTIDKSHYYCICHYEKLSWTTPGLLTHTKVWRSDILSFADINNIILLKYMYKHRVKLSIKVWWAIYCKHRYILTVLIKCKVPALTFGYYFNHYKHNWPPHCVISSLINGLSLCWLSFDEVTRYIINIILPVNCDCHKCIM